MKKLGVNIDHVATLRNVREGVYPDPIEFARLCQLAGADNITFHLREDRRHIKDDDVKRLNDAVDIDLNFELACAEGVTKIAMEIQPAVITLVPEKREELTTEGGLNLDHQSQVLQETTDMFLNQEIAVSYFIEPELSIVDRSKEMGASAVEFHTGHYANAFGTAEGDVILDKIKLACDHAFELGLDVHVGHGLNLQNLAPLAEIQTVHSFQIGHAIVSDSLFHGVDHAVTLYRQKLNP